MTEFDFITQLQNMAFPQRIEVTLGIGDDAALCTVPVGMQLVTAIDTLVSGVHFPTSTSAFDIGYKALAVNLSDLAAMGATPVWMTLALTCPAPQSSWLHEFTQGLLTLATQHQVSLIGGDTTAGPLTVTIQVCGLVPVGQALLRSGAQVDDIIYVTGTLGDAGLGLFAGVQHKLSLPTDAQHFVINRLNRPTPRVQEGIRLRQIAHSAIDISDGLAADLGHILAASGVGARIEVETLPLSSALRAHLSPQHAATLALTAGDDYELCFTVPPGRTHLLAHLPTGSYTKIGVIEATPGLRCLLAEQPFILKRTGYQHFGELRPVTEIIGEI
jgi:thiamine-monophosphate kinase